MPDEQLAGQTAPVTDEAAVAAQTNAATDTGQTDGLAGETNDSPAEKTFTQKELDEILEKRLAKARRTARKEALQEYQALAQPRQPERQQQEAPDARPARKDGEADDAYLDRLTDWKLDERDRKESQKREQQNAKELATKTDRIYAQAQKLEGFDRDAFDELPLTKPIVEALIESDQAPELMKLMADHPEEIARIAKLSPARQAAELGKLEGKLENDEPDKPPVKQVSSAPAPINPLRKPSGTAKTYDTTDPRAAKEMSTAEWIKAEEARLRKKAAGHA